MTIFYRNDAAYIRVPKTASTTIVQAMFTGDRLILRWRHDNEILPGTARVVATVRNPYTRMESCIAMMRGFNSNLSSMRNMDAFRAVKYSMDPYITKSMGKGLEGGNPYWSAKIHALPMVDPRFKLTEATHIFKYEELNEKWGDIMELLYLDRDTPMGHVRKAPQPYKLSAAERELVAHHYAADFAAFGYSTDDYA